RVCARQGVTQAKRDQDFPERFRPSDRTVERADEHRRAPRNEPPRALVTRRVTQVNRGSPRLARRRSRRERLEAPLRALPLLPATARSSRDGWGGGARSVVRRAEKADLPASPLDASCDNVPVVGGRRRPSRSVGAGGTEATPWNAGG